ncbi:hypothetical protein BGZ51_007703 [Haplosporangium sp. Z 767]|nr:hypothetical protein BGZ51_007703 [Haplosporangium sp. Z 767]
MGATTVRDHRGVFAYFGTGYLGRRHDSAAHKATEFATHPEVYFTGNEYILADAPYALSQRVIPRYKETVLSQEQSAFKHTTHEGSHETHVYQLGSFVLISLVSDLRERAQS